MKYQEHFQPSAVQPFLDTLPKAVKPSSMICKYTQMIAYLCSLVHSNVTQKSAWMRLLHLQVLWRQLCRDYLVVYSLHANKVYELANPVSFTRHKQGHEKGIFI